MHRSLPPSPISSFTSLTVTMGFLMTPYEASCFPAGLLACGKCSADLEKSLCAVSRHRGPSESVSLAVAATSDGAFTVPHLSKSQEVKDDTEPAVRSQELTQKNLQGLFQFPGN